MREMRESGIEWLEDIPSHWKVMPNKRVMKKKKEICPQYQGEDILSLTMNGVIVRDLNAGGKMPATFDGYQRLTAGNLLMCLFDIDVTPRCIGLIKNTGLSSPAYSQFVVNEKGYAPYYYYYYLNLDHTKELLHMAKNLRHSLTEDQLGEISVAVPPYAEQVQIVEALEKKLPKVDTLIANVQAQIEKLKAYKQSLITEVVTKGLDPNVPMKDSGVEWIGSIAENFQILRLKNVAEILDQFRKPITADLRSQEGDVLYDYYGASGAIDKIDGYTIDDHVMLIGEDGANLKMRNLPLMYEVRGKAWINNHAHILKPKDNVLFYYLLYALEGLDINPYITGSAQPKLNQENLQVIQIPVPQLDVQAEIVKFILEKHKQIDRLIAIKEAKIEKLEQYKKSLIYEYVTGKKEVH